MNVSLVLATEHIKLWVESYKWREHTDLFHTDTSLIWTLSLPFGVRIREIQLYVQGWGGGGLVKLSSSHWWMSHTSRKRQALKVPKTKVTQNNEKIHVQYS